ncbi:hypothetical protein BVRB_7g161830 [Beta vulgaris subsp. vulgaris]|nr:hypothetical protein BVRB_7g161830 [Beta vulgaris subsp. vulgaris]
MKIEDDDEDDPWMQMTSKSGRMVEQVSLNSLPLTLKATTLLDP